MSDGFFIGELSRRTGVPAQTIRYYERIGLMEPSKRNEAKYRVFTEDDETRLKFIQQAKLFGLSLGEIKSLIDLRSQGVIPCEYLDEFVKAHLDELDRRIQEMVEFRDHVAKRYEKIKTSIASCPPNGTICGIIEQEHPKYLQSATSSRNRA